MSDDGIPTIEHSDLDRNPEMREEYLFTIQEFAQIAQMHEESVRRLCRQGRLTHLRIGGPGGHIRIPSRVLHKYIGGR